MSSGEPASRTVVLEHQGSNPCPSAYGRRGCRDVVDDGTPVGTPVLASSGTQFGTVPHVLQIPELDE